MSGSDEGATRGDAVTAADRIPTGVAPMRTSVAVRRWRIGLLVLGLLLLALGVYVLLDEVNPKRYVGILTWFVGALILHDGIIAPAVWGVTVLGRRAGSRLPAGVIAIVQIGLTMAGVLALLVVPEALKKAIGTASPSILPLDYRLNLVVYLVVIAVLTAIAALIYRAIAGRMRSSRQNTRPSADQA